jgi:HEAT repeat protein
MGRDRIMSKALKKKVHDLLKSANLDKAFRELESYPPQKVINPLFSFIQDTNQDIKWAAVRAMGAIVAGMADLDMESARVIMRRLMWNLNDESGGIGWGSPEAMGEILANHEGLAEEYTHVLLSYAREDGNYLELPVLQRGLLWGIKRLSEVKPHLIQDAEPYLSPYLQSADAEVRELAEQILNTLEPHGKTP